VIATMTEATVGNEQLFVIQLRDVTEERRLIDQAREGRKMEAIAPLAAGIAHDFNNLLMGIRGVVDLASRKLPEGHSVRSHLDEIRSVATSGASITQQLRSLATRGGFGLVSVDVDARISGMRGLLRTLLGEDVVLDLDLNAPDCRIEADPMEFEHTLLLLAVNSRNAMPSGGSMIVTTDLLEEPPAEVPGDFGGAPVLRLRVEDTGKMAPAASTEALSSVVDFAESLDGTCVSTQIGDSTVIDLWLPSMTIEREDMVEEVAETAETEPATILVVEDDRMVRRTLRQYLESANHRVFEAATAAEASALADKLASELDLLVTDSVLEDGYGVDVAEGVIGRAPGIGVLFVSGHGFAQLLQDRRVPEYARFLQKPFEREELLDDVADAIRAARSAAG
jgi:CheY-like chemotaxis protein